MYCTVTQVQHQLASALTSANPLAISSGTPVKGNLQSIGTTTSFGQVSQTIIVYYIQQADALIDAALSEQYVVPLQEKTDLQMNLLLDVDEYSADTIDVSRAFNLSVGDILHISDPTQGAEHYERAVVSEITDNNTIVLEDSLTLTYSAATAKVRRLKFDDPIPFLSAKLAAAMVYKKYFSAQVEPGKSEYGETMRAEAVQELNNIREGRTILHNATRRGWQWANPNMLDRYTLKGAVEDDGTRSDQGGR